MKPPLTPARITAAVEAAASSYELDPYLVRTSRQPRPSEARFAVYAALKAETSANISDIARAMDRDHTSILHGLERAEQLALDSDYAAKLDRIRAAVRADDALPTYTALLRASHQLDQHARMLPPSMLTAISEELRRMLRLVEQAQQPAADTDAQTARLYRSGGAA